MAAALPRLEGRAEGRFAAAELQDRLRVDADAREQIVAPLPAQGAPAVRVVVARDDDVAPGKRAAGRVVDVVEHGRAAEIRGGGGLVPLDGDGVEGPLLQLAGHLLELAQSQIRARRRPPLGGVLGLVADRQRRRSPRRTPPDFPPRRPPPPPPLLRAALPAGRPPRAPGKLNDPPRPPPPAGRRSRPRRCRSATR